MLKNKLYNKIYGMSLYRYIEIKQKIIKAIVPPAHMKVGVDADLIIYVTALNEPDETFLAWANSCLRDSVTGRPIAGQINFNLAFLDDSPPFMRYKPVYDFFVYYYILLIFDLDHSHSGFQ